MVRYLLCRPQGGLNDILCQIEKCCRYAEVTGRTVIVDTNYSDIKYFRDDFGKYFVSKQARLLLSLDDFNCSLENMQVFPGFLYGRINSHSPRWDQESKQFVDQQYNLPLTFDFNKNYQQQLLYHCQCGGGTLSLFAFLRMRIRNEIADELQSRLEKIGKPYDAIHIRNTDYKTNYIKAIDQLKALPFDALFLATDNQLVLEEFRAQFGEERVFSFASFPDSQGIPIHKIILASNQTFIRNLDSILDLLMLALSRKIMLVNLNENRNSVNYSGYSLLARELWSAKRILADLISCQNLKIGLD